MKRNFAVYWSGVVLLVLSVVLVKGDNVMPRGRPDGNLQPFSYASQVGDPGAIYQMLWGFSPVDSQGRMFYLDTWNNGLAGVNDNAAGSALVPILYSTPATGNVFMPPNTVLVRPGVVNNDPSWLSREFFLGVNRRLGIEAAVLFSSTTPNYFIAIDYRIDASHRYTSRLKYNHNSGVWQIDVAGGGTQDVFTRAVPSGGFGHMQIKIVADWSTGKYVRALIGDRLIDLSVYDMVASGSSEDDLVIATFGARSYGAGSGDGYLGYILLTKDEP